MSVSLLWFAAGLAGLLYGATMTVSSGGELAARWRVRPMVISLVLVAWGSGLPEFTVTAGAALKGQGEIGLGNVLDSNVANILLVLGLAVVVRPVHIDSHARRDLAWLGAITALAMLLGMDGSLGPLDGVALMGVLAAHSVVLYLAARRDGKKSQAPAVKGRHRLVLLGRLVLGLALLVVGATWMIEGGVALGRMAGLSDMAIGLLVLAIGTSLPEVAAALAAARMDQAEMALGTVIGSNLFNLGAALGFAALLSGGIAISPEVWRLDFGLLVVLMLFFIPWYRGVMPRWQGLAMVACFAAWVYLKA